MAPLGIIRFRSMWRRLQNLGKNSRMFAGRGISDVISFVKSVRLGWPRKKSPGLSFRAKRGIALHSKTQEQRAISRRKACHGMANIGYFRSLFGR